MIDVEQIYLVSRYMIEDNAQEWVDYDEDNQQNIHIVKSIFSKFVGKYKIFSEDDDARLRDEISSVQYKFIIMQANHKIQEVNTFLLSHLQSVVFGERANCQSLQLYGTGVHT